MSLPMGTLCQPEFHRAARWAPTRTPCYLEIYRPAIVQFSALTPANRAYNSLMRRTLLVAALVMWLGSMQLSAQHGGGHASGGGGHSEPAPIWQLRVDCCALGPLLGASQIVQNLNSIWKENGKIRVSTCCSPPALLCT